MDIKIILLLFIIALIMSAVGFKNYVYFMSIGYGLAIAGISACSLIIFHENINTASLLMGALLIAYGLRLSIFLIYREKNSSGYKKVLDESSKNKDTMALWTKLLIWVAVCVMYMFQTAALYLRLSSNYEVTNLTYIFVILSALGLILESMSDIQKSAQKKENPHMVATKGLYKIVRCPNYLGEVVFWTGIFCTLLNKSAKVTHIIIGLIGYILIVYVMVDGAKRLSKKQDKRYGEKKEYVDYKEKTHLLIPFIF